MEALAEQGRDGYSDIVAIGFGTTVAMWAVGYVCRMPAAWVPSWLVLGLLLACIFTGGFAGGRYADRGWKAGLYSGLLSSILNLLVLGSLLGGGEPNRLAPAALWWIPGSILAGAVLGSLGAAAGGIGTRRDGRPAAAPDWTAAFAQVAVVATLLLLIVGGLVTSNRAGLAVVDWPNSFGYSMFLYPLSRMTGGIYYEHAHRLFGSLVGLTTLVLTILLLRKDRRAWLRRFAVAALLTVAAQGLLGGLRVTGHFTMSRSPDQTAPSLALAVVHGVLGQVFFAMLVSIGVFTSRSWKSARPATVRMSAATERSLAAALTILLIVQLVLGAIQRHLSGGLLIHITMAALVFLLALACGVRAWGMYKEQPLIQRLGKILVLAVCVQIALGIGAMIGKGMETHAGSPLPISVVIRTTHQAVGAMLLACATMLALWTRRLLAPQG